MQIGKHGTAFLILHVTLRFNRNFFGAGVKLDLKSRKRMIKLLVFSFIHIGLCLVLDFILTSFHN